MIGCEKQVDGIRKGELQATKIEWCDGWEESGGSGLHNAEDRRKNLNIN